MAKASVRATTRARAATQIAGTLTGRNRQRRAEAMVGEAVGRQRTTAATRAGRVAQIGRNVGRAVRRAGG